MARFAWLVLCFVVSVGLALEVPGWALGGAKGRFAISTDGLTVTDTATGLVWQRDGAGSRTNCAGDPLCTLAEASAYCGELALGGLSTWRLPSSSELESLVEKEPESPEFPVINRSAFPKTPPGRFWTFERVSEDLAWVSDGTAMTASVSKPNRVRCVRGRLLTARSRFAPNAKEPVPNAKRFHISKRPPEKPALPVAPAGCFRSNAHDMTRTIRLCLLPATTTAGKFSLTKHDIVPDASFSEDYQGTYARAGNALVLTAQTQSAQQRSEQPPAGALAPEPPEPSPAAVQFRARIQRSEGEPSIVLTPPAGLPSRSPMPWPPSVSLQREP
jgi:hypothetical protein